MNIITAMQEVENDFRNLSLIYHKAKKQLTMQHETVWQTFAEELADNIPGEWEVTVSPKNEFGFYMIHMERGNTEIRVSYNNGTVDCAINGMEVFSDDEKATTKQLAAKINKFLKKNEEFPMSMKNIAYSPDSKFAARINTRVDEYTNESNPDEVFKRDMEIAENSLREIEKGLKKMARQRKPGSWTFTGRGAELPDILTKLDEILEILPR